MTDFTPSPKFTAQTMAEIRRYEAQLQSRRNRADAFLQSKPGILILSAGGTLFGLLNLLRLASTLLFPALCR